MLAIPMRAFVYLTRPVLRVLNEMANWSLRNVGGLDASYSDQIAGALELQSLTVRDTLTKPADSPAWRGLGQRGVA